MRISLSIFILSVVSCENKKTQSNPEGLTEFASVVDSSGYDRLRLVYVVRYIDGQEGHGYDFDSIVWDRRSNGIWEEQKKITQEDFENNTDRDRWVSDIHSFDASTNSAILKIGEGDAPRGADAINIIYSWRKWDIETNTELEFFYECQPNELFEPFRPRK